MVLPGGFWFQGYLPQALIPIRFRSEDCLAPRSMLNGVVWLFLVGVGPLFHLAWLGLGHMVRGYRAAGFSVWD